MDYEQARAVAGEKKNLVFIGESGSGKTEAALNFAVALAKGGKEVHFFDMDQTKPLFRARDLEKELGPAGVMIHYQEQLMDLPTVVPAVNEILSDENVYVVMDVGGSDQGAHMIGQFNQRLNAPDTAAFYLVNPYRAWGGSAEEISQSVSMVLKGCRIRNIHMVFNPTLGLETSAEEAVEGSRTLAQLLGIKPTFTLAREEIAQQVASQLTELVLALHVYIRYPWQVSGTAVTKS